jgi:hypothetical protein
VAPRSRVFAFGSMGALVVAGAISAAFVDGFTGDVVGLALVTLGLGGALLLLFLEVGLSEDRERAAEERRRSREAQRAQPKRRLRLPRRPRRPG